MAATGAVGLAAGSLLLAAGRIGAGSFTAGALGCVLAVASATIGFAALLRVRLQNASAFSTLLLGLFVGRVALVGLFGLALHRVAPAHLVVGLVSLAGFHFVFAVLEVVLLARCRPPAVSQRV